MRIVCSRQKIDLICQGYEAWRIALHVSSVHLTMVVKLVSVLLNFASNINTHQELCSGRTWKRHSIAMCGTYVSWFQNKSRTNKITLCYLRNNSVDTLYTVNFIHYIAITRMEIIFVPTSLNDITFYCFTLFLEQQVQISCCCSLKILRIFMPYSA